MNYIICKTFWKQDEVIVDKQWDLEMGRKGGRRKREGRERERKRDSMKLLPIRYSALIWWSFILAIGNLRLTSPLLKPPIINAHAHSIHVCTRSPN